MSQQMVLGHTITPKINSQWSKYWKTKQILATHPEEDMHIPNYIFFKRNVCQNASIRSTSPGSNKKIKQKSQDVFQ